MSSTAISTITMVQSNAAMIQATAARAAAERAECTAWMHGFKHDIAAVGERRQYAECVQLLWPAPSAAPTVGDKVMLVLAIVLFLACIGYGIKIAKRDKYADTIAYVGWGVIGAIVGMVAAAGLYAAVWAAGYIAA